MQSGLFHGYVSLVEGSSGGSARSSGSKRRSSRPAGSRPCSRRSFRSSTAVDPHLTLLGLRLIWEQEPPMKVLFVCDGNICRSPLAAEYLRHRAVREGLSHRRRRLGRAARDRGRPGGAVSDRGRHGGRARPDAPPLARRHDRGRAHRRPRRRDDAARSSRRFARRLSATGGQRRLLLRAFEDGPTPRGGAPELDDPVAGPIEGYQRRLRDHPEVRRSPRPPSPARAVSPAGDERRYVRAVERRLVEASGETGGRLAARVRGDRRLAAARHPAGRRPRGDRRLRQAAIGPRPRRR